MRPIRLLGQFLVDLIIGDDPKIAVAVVVAVGLAALLLIAGGASASVVTVVGALLVVSAFSVSLFLDTR
ncbi:MAG: hypothetical protein H0U61_01805 [Nocardioidaceae bacterium]|nr:hypothetical protein [Nocardioidaceae bacterium]